MTSAIRDNRLRVYLAGPSAELELAQELTATLRALPNVLVVSTWTERLPATRATYGAKSDRDVPRAVLKADLRKDLEELATADVIVRRCGKSDGAATEWGYSLAK